MFNRNVLSFYILPPAGEMKCKQSVVVQWSPPEEREAERMRIIVKHEETVTIFYFLHLLDKLL